MNKQNLKEHILFGSVERQFVVFSVCVQWFILMFGIFKKASII